MKCYTKTINHSKSTKKEFGEWVHPDIVGCYFPIDEWDTQVMNLSSAIGNTSIKILSFELKRELNLGKLRESFFQAVSNSSWANESYLVAAEISNNDDNSYLNYRAIKEAKMTFPFDEELDDIDVGIEVDLEMLREDLVGELQAINQYQEHIELLDDEDAIAVLEHIRDDEKEHVAELVKLIQQLDPVQAEKFKKEIL